MVFNENQLAVVATWFCICPAAVTLAAMLVTPPAMVVNMSVAAGLNPAGTEANVVLAAYTGVVINP
jgi:hypothetical protein